MSAPPGHSAEPEGARSTPETHGHDGSVPGPPPSPPEGLREARMLIGVVGLALASNAAAGPHLFDAGELVTAGFGLGASHPPGQPLHALLAHAAILLVPFGPIAWRVSLVSVLFGCLAAGSVATLVASSLARPEGASGPATRWLPSAASLGVLGAPAVLPQLTRPEVYALALFLTLEAVRHLLAWAWRLPGARGSLRRAALLAGLTVAVHPPHALAALAVGAVLWGVHRRDTRIRTLATAALACTAGGLVLAYMTVRSGAGAAMWGEATTLRGLFEYVSGHAYHRNLGAGRGSLSTRLPEVLGFVLWPSGIVALVGAGLALTVLRATARQRLRAAGVGALACAAGAASTGALLQALEPANPDNIAYAAPAMALTIAVGALFVDATTRRRGTAHGLVGALMVAALPIAGADVRGALPGDLPSLETLAFGALDGPPPRALVVVESDLLGACWIAGRGVEGARPDVALLIEGLSTSSWHWRTLAGHPLFDGSPRRAGPGTGYGPWVRGALTTALGHVAIASESDLTVDGRGEMVGPYLVLSPTGADDAGGWAARTFAERTADVPGWMLEASPPGHADAGRGVVRAQDMARAHRALVRGRTAAALSMLRRASSPQRPARPEPDGWPTGPMRRPEAPIVRDPARIFPSDEDAVRALATALHAVGEQGAAATLLDAQATRDDRAWLQLAWLLAADGMLDPAREALGHYAALHPDRAAEWSALAARLP